MARSSFLEHGASVSTSKIAEILGVSQAALFKRFGTKQQLLFRAMLPAAIPPWAMVASSGPDERPLDGQLLEIAIAVISFFQTMLPCVMVLRNSGVDPEDLIRHFDTPPPVVGHLAIKAWFQRAMDQGRIRKCDASMLAFNFIGAFHGRIMIDHLARGHFGDIDTEAYAKHTVDVMMRGLQVAG